MKQLTIIILFFAFANNAFAQANDSTIALIKQNLATSKENLKKYEWLETTTTFIDGEQKSKTQNRCYYDVTGKLVKVATGEPPSEGKDKRGIRGNIVENKKEEMQDYIKKSIEKIHSYLPPDAAKLQQIYASGKTAVNVLEPNKKFKLDFPDYLQQGDKLGIAIDKEKSLINGVTVNTYLDKPDDKVDFEVKYDALPDGTQYQSETTLIAKAKKVKIVIQNSGYKKTVG